MRSRWMTLVVVLALLLGSGVLLRPLEVTTRARVRENQPALEFSEVEGAAGQGILLGLLSGGRALLADLVWIRGYTAWAETDVERASALIHLAVGIDPRPLFFWINGGRTIGYDIPVWGIDQAGGETHLPRLVVDRIRRDQAERALQFYDRGLGYHPDQPWLLVDMANIHQRKLNDLEGAAELYRRAAEVPGAPWFAARIYAELLQRLGRDREAYDWLVALHPTLPPRDPSAMAPIVLGRIRALEDKLAIPEAERYRASEPVQE
ncbi:MAG: hypothetical protein R3F07_12105 [Opitutaceae bacterium]